MLVEARSTRRGAVREPDIADPIDGPAEAHVAAVDQIAVALQPLIATLDVRPLSDETVRMHRLPPVPSLP